MTRNKSKASVRQRVERIDRVSRTWFELDNNGGDTTKTLVVEVTFDTDPHSPGFLQAIIDEIEETTVTLLKNENPMNISSLRIVPRSGDVAQ